MTRGEAKDWRRRLATDPGVRWRCTHRRCDRPAAAIIEPPAGPGTWYGCADHLPGMTKALSTGFGGSDEASVAIFPKESA